MLSSAAQVTPKAPSEAPRRPPVVDLEWKGSGTRVAVTADHLQMIAETKEPGASRVVFRNGDSMVAVRPSFTELRDLMREWS